MDSPTPRMPRRAFLKTSLAGAAGLGLMGSVTAAEPRRPTASQPVIRRTLGRTGITVPVVSMGVMNADNPNLVRAALDAGIVLLDTAHVYQQGRNEEMIGTVIKGRPRDSFVLATKVPGPRHRDGDASPSSTEITRDFLNKLDISLKRLGLDHVDILYCHNVTTREATLLEPVLKALETAKKSGKTRFVGVSTHRNEPEVLQAAIDSHFYDVVLTAYNFLQDHHEDVLAAITRAAKAGLGIVAMKTQAGVYWERDKSRPINMTAALKWALQDPHVHTAIPGFTTFDQLELDTAIMRNLTLTEGERRELNPPATAALYCQQCGRCEAQCVRSLPLPSLMRGYMYAYGYRNLEAAHELVTSLDVSGNPCGDCTTCPVHCRRGIDVRHRATDIARLKHVPGDLFA